MRIQIDGVNTTNKGAELMLVSILEEIQRKFPNATVYINPNQKLNLEILPEIKNPIKVRKALLFSRYGIAILKRLNISYTFFTHLYPKNSRDIVLDASGFQYSDQWGYTENQIKERYNYYEKLNNFKVKTIFLPQAFGPFETSLGKKSIVALNKFVDLVIAREQVSYDYIKGLDFSEEKLWKYPDFTFKTKGTIPERFQNLKGKVCIIPNNKMISHTELNENLYIDFLVNAITFFKDMGKDVFLLNHEGIGDYNLCNEINTKFDSQLPVVSGLTAKEVKGVISQSYMVISSRFHGVASSLSSGVPCLCTSWNHKYKMLYADFEVDSQVLKLSDSWDLNKSKIKNVYDNRESIHEQLLKMKPNLVAKNEKMWQEIWGIL